MLAEFERLLEQAVEGGLRRIFPADLHPVQLAKAAARAMEDSQAIGVSETRVANLVTVLVAPADYARFAEYGGTLRAELAQYLERYAADRGLVLAGPIEVALQPDEKLGTGRVRASARFRDAAPPAAPSPSPVPRAASGRGWLVDEAGGRYPLLPEDELLRVGRSLDNDVVVSDRRVSRFHVQLRWDGRRWMVRDLQSTNGTFVDGHQLADGHAELRPGGELRLGGLALTYTPE